MANLLPVFETQDDGRVMFKGAWVDEASGLVGVLEVPDVPAAGLVPGSTLRAPVAFRVDVPAETR